MSGRYLFGPVSRTFVDQNLAEACEAGTCLAFGSAGAPGVAVGPSDSWESICARLPAGWQPDFIVLYLPFAAIAPALWSAPVPVVGLAAGWQLQWHYYRHCLRRCDLVLADQAGVKTLRRPAVHHARAADLSGYARPLL